jgi:hypothetical protein
VAGSGAGQHGGCHYRPFGVGVVFASSACPGRSYALNTFT